MRRRLILALSIAAPAALLAAAPPSALSQVAGGVWEITGAPGTQAPFRQCITDVLTLARFEHRTRNCSQSVLSDGPSSTRINYDCGGAGFGQTKVDVITPRSLRISTQGIADQQPFNYVLQARRVGDCAKSPSAPHH
jgi:hypothetical protein